MNFKITSALIGLLLVFAALLVGAVSRLNHVTDERDQAIKFVQSDASKVSYYKNKLDRETAKSGVLELSLRNTRQMLQDDRLSFVRQFDGVNKRLNNLDQTMRTTAQIVTELELPLRDTMILNIDSTLLPGKVFSYRDSLNVISGTIIGNKITPRIEITVPLQGVVYFQRKKFLGLRIGRKEWFSDIASTNKNVHITEHEVIKIKRK